MTFAREYLAMGGYGSYIWSAYAIAAAIIIGLLIWSWMELKSMERREAQLGRRRRRKTRTEPVE